MFSFSSRLFLIWTISPHNPLFIRDSWLLRVVGTSWEEIDIYTFPQYRLLVSQFFGSLQFIREFFPQNFTDKYFLNSFAATVISLLTFPIRSTLNVIQIKISLISSFPFVAFKTFPSLMKMQWQWRARIAPTYLVENVDIWLEKESLTIGSDPTIKREHFDILLNFGGDDHPGSKFEGERDDESIFPHEIQPFPPFSPSPSESSSSDSMSCEDRIYCHVTSWKPHSENHHYMSWINLKGL